MFKFIKQYAETIPNAGIYPLISLFIFFLFFVVLVYYVKNMGKDRVSYMSNIPLDTDETSTTTL